MDVNITLENVSTRTIEEWRAWLLRTKYVLSLSGTEFVKEYYDADGLYEMLDNPFETDTLYFVEKMISFLRRLKQLSNVDVGLKKPIPEPPKSLIEYIKSIVPEFEY